MGVTIKKSAEVLDWFSRFHKVIFTIGRLPHYFV